MKNANAKSDDCLQMLLVGTCTCILRRPRNEIMKPTNHISMHERLEGFARGWQGSLEAGRVCSRGSRSLLTAELEAEGAL